MVPVAHGGSGDAFSAKVKNVSDQLLQSELPPNAKPISGQIVWLQGGEPISLWCGDETDGETINACMTIFEPLLKFKYGTTLTEPALATSYDSIQMPPNNTFHLRQNVNGQMERPSQQRMSSPPIQLCGTTKIQTIKETRVYLSTLVAWLGLLNAPPPANSHASASCKRLHRKHD